MIFLLLVLSIGTLTSTTSEFISSIPCEYLANDKLLCRQTSFIQTNLPITNNQTDYSQITNFEWIESGAYILSHHIFDSFDNLKNVSLRSNTLTSLTVLPFWSLLRNTAHLDLSQNRLISLNNRDFQSFHRLTSLNISLNFLTTVEPIWLFLPLQMLDLSNNGINFLGNIKLQNSTPEFPSCLVKHIYLNQNRGLLSFSQLQTTIMDYCPFLERFQLINNHWHCSCSDLVHSLKHYRTLNLLDDSSQTLTGQCETPLSLRHIDIQKMTEELVCDHLVLFDSILNDEASQASFYFSRQVIFLFLIGCFIGCLIGLCLHYCAHRCYDLIYLILYKCDREKMANDRTSNESISMNETNLNSEQFIYYPRTEIDQLPSYSQVMNDIFYLDILTRRPTDEHDGEC